MSDDWVYVDLKASQETWKRGNKQGRQDEREAIVEWLREKANTGFWPDRATLMELLNQVEKGYHEQRKHCSVRR